MPLRVLLLDDNPDDRALALRILRAEFGELEATEAVDAAEFARALDRGGFDLVITDFHLHWTDGLKNLSAVKSRHPRIPVIMFTGTGTEETAVVAMKAGLDDYVIKAPQHLGRLAIAVRSVLAKLREQEGRAEAERRYRSLFDGVPIGIFRTTPEGRALDVNPALARLLGYPDPESLKAMNAVSFYLRPEDRERWKALVDAAGSVSDFEFPLRRRDGRIIRVRENARAVRDGRGRVLYYEGSIEDITVAKQAEEALLASEEKYRSLLKGVADEVILLDPRGKILLANDAADVSLGGGTPIAGKNIGDLFPPGLIGRFREVLRGVIRRRRSAVHVDWQGGRNIESVISPILDARGRAAGATVVSRDITERKRSENALKESEEQFRTIFENSSSAMAIIEKDTTISMVNREYCRLGGYEEKDVIGKSWTSQIPPEDLARLEEYNRKRLLDPKSAPDQYEFAFYRKDGGIRNALISVAVLPTSRRIVCSFVDITERKRAAEALAKQEKLYRTLFELAPSGILLEDAEGRIVDVNSTVCRNLGYTRDELVRMTIYDLAHPEGRGAVKRHMARIFAGEILHHAVKNVRKDGAMSFMELHETRFPLPDGTDGILVLSNDITERMKMEASLRESEEQFRNLFELSPVGKFLLDLKGKIVAVNERGSAIYGYSRAGILGKNVRKIVPRRLASRYPRLVAAVRAKQILRFDSEGKRRNGATFPVELAVSLFPWKGREHLQVLVQDITEKRRVAEAENIRRISGALLQIQEEERKKIARDLHDHIGQDLAAIKISLGMSKIRLPAREAAARTEIEETVRLVDKAIGDVRSLSSSLRPASLDELGLVPCLRHEFDYLASRGGLAIELAAGRLGGRLPPEKEIVVYRIVQEAMTNILKHARARRVRVRLSRRGGLVRLSVSDDGRGFHPKDGKSPPGLGLLGMRERVTLAGGKFAIASRPERGTRIVVTLPSAPGKGRKS